MKKVSIRLKITLWFAAALIIIVAFTISVILFISNEVLQKTVRDSLIETVENNVAVCTVAIGGIGGIIIGSLTGFYGGILDEIVMRVNDVLLSFPSVLLVLIFISFIGTGKYKIIWALGIMFIPSFARIVRSEVIRYKSQEFVKSALVMGAGNLRIIFVHILPNTTVSLLTAAAIGFNNAVLAEASMSYLGLGVQPPDPSLGRMLSEAQAYIFNAPWYALFPGVVIVLIILGFSLISEGLRSISN